MMTPTSVSSRLSARPVMPWPRSSISFSITSSSPSTRATPSPISRMMPTLRLIAAVLTPAIWRSRSCKRLAIFSPCRVRKDQAYETVSSEELFERRQATLDAVVVHVAADLDAHAADECGIVAERGHDSLTESLRNSGLDSGLRVGRE